MLSALAIHVLSFLGIIAGFIVAHYSYDELKDGSQYFRVLRNIFIILIILALTLTIKFQYYHILLFIAGILFGYFFRFTSLYLGLAGVIGILSGNLALIPSLIFLYGLPEGTLQYYHHKSETLKRHTLFKLLLFVLPLVLLAAPNLTVLASFAMGALIMQLT